MALSTFHGNELCEYIVKDVMAASNRHSTTQTRNYQHASQAKKGCRKLGYKNKY
jgi:hypothetical protein